ncbi:MAG: hypothetical protein SGPRY_010674, partial [Prymnesium sp.]
MAKKEECVRVCVRCRPLNKTELADGRGKVVEMDLKSGSITLYPTAANDRAAEPPKTFTFDQVYDENTTQEFIYSQTASRIVDSVLEGFNGTIFAYGQVQPHLPILQGSPASSLPSTTPTNLLARLPSSSAPFPQTGTGKTFTMEGAKAPPELLGVIPRAFTQIFESISSRGGEHTEFLVRASYLEIYNEEIRDLLSKNPHNKLDLKEAESGVYVRDLTSYVVKTTRECDKLRDFGAKNRHVGSTAMNQDSSRSHSIYTITVESCETKDDGTSSIRMGKLNLVDLAGSERQSKTQASGDRLKEATKINLSLSALGNCISALVDGKSTHIPYRDSKLTRLLQACALTTTFSDSLGGNTKTVMVANLGPADWNYDETLSTLRYANRAKNIKNKPKINEDPKDAMLREFQEEIARLKAALADAEGGEAYLDENGQIQVRPDVEDVLVENVVEVEKEVEVEKVVEKLVEVEKVVEVERVVEREVEVEVEVEVEHIVE